MSLCLQGDRSLGIEHYTSYHLELSMACAFVEMLVSFIPGAPGW